ncbi:DgyrCDS2515 [Dimorphilus gyrociliatus]|uniref:DgyrCDS2515 n=1 Tax=Dimorphilus gyrociliatus TaxID=2664684 RepID=A0A7I8VCG6_9ANNE|nr:DgyrCDS2515 [Dimorphilus gyrociliatus]
MLHREQSVASRSSVDSYCPPSLDVVHRTIVVTATQASMDVKTFRVTSPKLSEKTNFHKLQSIASDLLRSWGIKESDVRGFKEFRKLLNEKYVKDSVRRTNEFLQLENVCERARMFDNLVSKVKEKIEIAGRSDIKKYCLSLIREADAYNIKLAREYDERIFIYKRKIDERLDKMDEVWAEYEDLKSPFVFSYVGCGNLTWKLMDEFCTIASDVSEMIRKWIYEDKTYTTKLWDEIVQTNGQKNKLLELIKRNKRKMEDFAKVVKKNDDSFKKLNKSLKISKKQYDTEKNKFDSLVEDLHHLQELTKLEEGQLKVHENIVNTRNFNSPTLLDILWAKIDHCRETIEHLNDQTKRIENTLNKSRENLEEVQKKLENAKQKMSEEVKDTKGNNLKVGDIEKTIKHLEEEVEIKEKKLLALKKLRNMKLSPKMIKILHYSRNDNLFFSYSDLNDEMLT